MKLERRVVITGLGCITALADSADALFEALCRGESGISTIESFDTSTFSVHFGGEIKNFNIDNYVPSREGRRMDRFTQMALASAIQAVSDSGLDFEKEDKDRVGVIVGTGIGGIKEIEEQYLRLLEKGPRKVSPFCVPKLMGNAASGCISIQYGLKGPNMCVVTACASAAHAIGEAFYNILCERSDIVITGGSEAALTPIGLASFCALKSLSTRNEDPQHASRPFDVERDGFVLAEGAAVLVLEEYEHAKRRGAKIYGEMLGYGATGDGYHITAPLEDGSGAAKAMKLALQQAQLNPDQIDYINAHGTSTELNDAAESLAIRTVFGEHAYKLSVSSTKSCLGHSLGASGAIELAVCAKTIEKGRIHPTINLERVAPECDPKIDFVPKQAREKKVRYVLSNSLGFGGHNCSLIIGKI
ncbi:MAG TPA: beta-ketoacyl-ACP synthase II [Anaerohalosphaeraceae bacterium]|jgi:3-oxoacyl-[acyl-carrier-protein] synthase II|nr:beta-ketoacyl-ACP synthase II [Anaerohalosphaeraceae bacterium]HQG05206.1 beta-ketoacyl-ACP synthase II [Anaerohalosphaeraceae bacterium]HQI06924.1 beta-ketoacyl-ACP synthase II [Anaerohalosphaeraceae bacterium]HQJ66620.1 beta-ketoacyl-ACP synthase II [Anaerohalosphaeraceae bacterium]